jgi:hypothetical protein
MKSGLLFFLIGDSKKSWDRHMFDILSEILVKMYLCSSAFNHMGNGDRRWVY